MVARTMNQKDNVHAIKIINIINLHRPDILLIKFNDSSHALSIGDNNIVRYAKNIYIYR
jgi:hypothetical protein